MKRSMLVIIPALILLGLSVTGRGGETIEIINTQDPEDTPLAPEAALGRVTAPNGFVVTLFAAEPDVRQPIAMAFDERGRLWVVENYSYPEYEQRGRDRVLIFEDADHDGRFDTRKVFYDRGDQFTGIEIGFGGVWVTAAPHLLFIPDADRDDEPDREPEAVLDGWNYRDAKHNIVNGLRWGPDGWLYGRHGITATSHVGRPGAPDEQRVMVNGSIWRYHPTRRAFEIVSHGTTNPWGFDYDDHGQMFFTNNVIGHLWHAVPGAHFKRMHGADPTPHVYALMDQCADHLHWAGGDWTKTRNIGGEQDPAHSRLGGGHSHCGGMIYLGDNWPQRYRNTIFTCNTHGKRINNDILERRGSGYTARHGEDFFFAHDLWFRGVDIETGPDGGVFVSDWTDLGECHDEDGVHRASGRIYKITYGRPEKPEAGDLAALSDAELVELQLHRNDWYVRRARRLLQERHAAGREMGEARRALRRMFDEHPDITRKLRAMWALHAAGGAEPRWLIDQLGHDNEHIRVWAIRLLVDGGGAPVAAVERFERMAVEDPSSFVRLYLASALQRLPAERRWAIAGGLNAHPEDASDANLPLMNWYAIREAVPRQPQRAIELASQTRFGVVRRFIARRLTHEIDEHPEHAAGLVGLLAPSRDEAFTLDILRGMAEALRGRRKVDPPEGWPAVRRRLARSDGDEVRRLADELAVLFGDGQTLEKLRSIALDDEAPTEARRRAIRVLAEARHEGFAEDLQRLAGDQRVRTAAIRGLAAYDHRRTPNALFGLYGYADRVDKSAAIDVLVSRPGYAQALLDAVEAGRIPASDITAFQAGRIANLGDETLTGRLRELWGSVRQTPAEKEALIARYKAKLTPEALAEADRSNGRLLFRQLCAQCHRLFGEGGDIGPDLTGSGRGDLDYVLLNVVDPSAVVAGDYRMSMVTTTDGRVVAGTIGQRTDRTLTVQTTTEPVVLSRDEVQQTVTLPMSLMPEGLLSGLSDEQVRDLVAYLGGEGRAALPEGHEAGSR